MYLLVTFLACILYINTEYIAGSCPDIHEPNDHCSKYNDDRLSKSKSVVCSCRQDGCDFSVTSKKCVPPQKCKDRFGNCKKFKNNTCLRRGVYYIDGGVLCENKEDQGNCEISDTLVAVKAGLEIGDILVDSRDVMYVHEANYIDPEDVRTIEPPKVQKQACSLDAITHEDKELFVNPIYGATESRGRNVCLGYLLPWIEQIGVGVYELSIKLMEGHFKTTSISRSFTLKLNNLVLVKELDISKYVDPCTPFEIIALFEKRNIDEPVVVVQGHAPLKYDGEQMELKFCYGTCYDDPGLGDFMWSAFYVARLENGVPDAGDDMVLVRQYSDEDEWKSASEEQDKLTARMGDRPREMSSGSVTPISDDEDVDAFIDDKNTCKVNNASKSQCDEHAGSTCNCVQNGCEASVDMGTCSEAKSCQEIFAQCATPEDMCLRAGVFYIDRGVLCKNDVNQGKCDVLETLIGVKAASNNGATFVDSRYVKYGPETAFEDPGETREQLQPITEYLKMCGWNWKEVPTEDIHLFQTMVFGNSAKRGKDCISYSLPSMNASGRYELSLRFLETLYKDTTIKRTFTVKLGRLTVLTELDVFKHVGHCKPMEIIIPIEVTDDEKLVWVQGYPPMMNDKTQIGELTFCYGECFTDPGDGNWMISSFYLARLGKFDGPCPDVMGENDQCDKFNDYDKYPDRILECKSSGCELNDITGKCVPRGSCKDRFGNCSTFNKTRCLREGIYYADGGVLCSNKERSGYCEIEETIVAVKAGLEEGETIEDSRGIKYTPATNFVDPSNLRKTQSHPTQLKKCNFETFDHTDKPMFATQITGTTDKRSPNNCIGYPIPWVNVTGEYELSIKLIETELETLEQKRSFNIMLNGVELVKELNVFGYVGFCKPMEIIIPFEMKYEDGDEMVVIQGHPPLINDGNDMQLKFCYGKLYLDPDLGDFMWSAYYVALFDIDETGEHTSETATKEPNGIGKVPKQATEPDESSDADNENDSSTKQKSGRSWSADENLDSPVTPTAETDDEEAPRGRAATSDAVMKCGDYGSSTCDCIKAGCEASRDTGTCAAYNSCQETFAESKVKPDQCLRAGAYYLSGGILCKNEVDSGMCDVLSTLIGVKATVDNGTKITDSRFVTYGHEENYEDPDNIRQQTNPLSRNLKSCSWDWTHIPLEDVNLYQMFVFGNTGKRGKSCLSYLLPPMKQPGQYELSLKFLEGYHNNEAVRRTFNVKLGNITVLTELDVFKHVGKCQPMEVIIPIEVTEGGKSVLVPGYPPIPNDADHIGRLTFCYGECFNNPGDPNWMISAFYLARLGKFDGPCQDVSDNNEQCGEFNDRNKYPNNVYPCKAAGCEISITTGKCVPPQNCKKRFDQCNSWNKNNCLREGVFYSDGGVLCNNEEKLGKCKVVDTVVGVKAGLGDGQTIDDSRKVTYTHESNYVDEHKIRRTESFVAQQKKCNFDTVTHPDKHMFATQIYGAPNKRSPDICLAYPIPAINVTGDYELSVKFMETYLQNPNTRRSFNLMLNDFMLVEEVDIFRYVGFCKPMEVIAPFQLIREGDQDMFVLKGRQPMIYDKDNFYLKFCYGSAFSNPGLGDFTWSAFYVARLDPNGADDEEAPRGRAATSQSVMKCGDYRSSTCDCIKAGCEASTDTGTCAAYNSCQETFAESKVKPDQCLRAGAYYLSGGILCKNEVDRGMCDVLSTLIGVKATVDNGTKITDSRFVTYGHEENYEDPDNIRQQTNPLSKNLKSCSWDWKHIPPEDVNLYQMFVFGNTGKRGKSCLSYLLPPMKQPGQYELSLKFLEGYHNSEAVRRTFNVKLGNITVLTELDVFKHVGKCQPMEVIIPVEVSEGGKSALIPGYLPIPNDADHIGRLTFCYGECFKNPGDPNWMISAFYLARLGKFDTPCKDVSDNNEQCGQFNDRNKYPNNVYPCKAAGCEISITTGKCVPPQNCKKRFDQCNSWNKNNCLREGVYYSDGGVLCNNEEKVGKCKVVDTVVGVKAGLGDGKTIEDSRKVTYTHEVNYLDEHKIRRMQSFVAQQKRCNFDTFTHPDKQMFATQIYGATDKRSTNICLAYPIPPINATGYYELSVKFIEAYLENSNTRRSFNLMLNDFTLVEELDVFGYVGFCKPMEVIAPFQLIREDGQDMFVLKGRQPMPYDRDNFYLKFCYGGAFPKPGIGDFMWSAFYVARLDPNGEDDEEAPRGRAATSDAVMKCGDYRSSTCDCIKAGCEASKDTGTCAEYNSCQETFAESKVKPDQCLRAGAYYLSGGILCKNEVDRGMCDVLSTLIGVKPTVDNGTKITDSRFVTYGHEENYEDPDNIRQQTNPLSKNLKSCSWDWKHIPPEDVNLYQMFVFGNTGKRGKSCLSYLLPAMKQPGQYELSLKFLEGYHNSEAVRRTFNVKLGNITVLTELDVFKHVGKCQPMEVIIPIQVTDGGKSVLVPGYPPMPNDGDHIGRLTFCYGECFKNPGDPNWMISAFYLARLGKFDKPCQDVSDNNDQCGQFNDRNKYPNNVYPCKAAGCEISITTGKCVPPQNCKKRFDQCNSWNKNNCLREGVYYSDGGVLCNNEEKLGKCKVVDTVVGVKAGLGDGKTIEDSRKVTYNQEINYVDPHKIRRTQSYVAQQKKCNFDTITHPDKQMFATQIYGAPDQRSPSTCLAYPIPPINVTGDYELSVKFIETYLQNSNTRRSFNLMLNEFTLVEELDIFGYVGFCKPMEVIAPFQLIREGDQDMFVLKGRQPMPYDRDNFYLKFCYGSAFPKPGLGDFVWSAFYVARLDPNGAVEIEPASTTTDRPTTTELVTQATTTTTKTTTTKPTTTPKPNICEKFNDRKLYRDNVCPCKQVFCEYNVVYEECREPKTCVDLLGEKLYRTAAKCYRTGVHMAAAGSVCYSDKGEGSCKIDQVIIAVKAGLAKGKSIVDSRNVRYTHEANFIDKDKVRGVDQQSAQKCDFDKMTHPDKQLYIGQVYGKADRRHTKGCVSYPIPLMKQGDYELSLKFMESTLKGGMKRRSFIVKLGNFVLIEELDVENYAGETCKPLEIIVPFWIQYGEGRLKLIVKGHISENYNSKDVKLSFCYGNCNADFPDFVFSAFYVAKISNP